MALRVSVAGAIKNDDEALLSLSTIICRLDAAGIVKDEFIPYSL